MFLTSPFIDQAITRFDLLVIECNGDVSTATPRFLARLENPQIAMIVAVWCALSWVDVQIDDALGQLEKTPSKGATFRP
jgi:hypothetical protein